MQTHATMARTRRSGPPQALISAAPSNIPDGWKHTISYCPARLNGKQVYLHDWKTRPRDRLEIVADVKLREVFGLEDGDPVEVTIPSVYLSHVGQLSCWHRFRLDHEDVWEAAKRVVSHLVAGSRPSATGRTGDAGPQS